jgi:hypothetical protein
MKDIKEAQTQARLQLIAEVRRWAESGQSVKQLIFRLRTLHLTYDPSRRLQRTKDV